MSVPTVCLARSGFDGFMKGRALHIQKPHSHIEKKTQWIVAGLSHRQILGQLNLRTSSPRTSFGDGDVEAEHHWRCGVGHGLLQQPICEICDESLCETIGNCKDAW